jgi:hypothetical protein
MHSSEYQVEVDQSGPSEWAELLAQFQDANLYQTWSYGAIRWGEKNLSHLVLRHNGDAVGLVQLRIIRSRFLKSGIAYVRWGPMCHRANGELELEACRRMAAALREEYVRKRGLFLRLLPNAFRGTPRGEVYQAAFSEYSDDKLNRAAAERTIVLDLSPSLEELRKRLDQKWRNQLNRAEKNGLQIAEGEGTELYQTFLDIYRQMWARKRFDEGGVDVDEFGRIQESLSPSQKMRILICSQGATPVAGVVYSAMGNSAVYLLGATSDDGLKAKGAYLSQWTVIKWLKEHGFKYYDLGGINPERNPGVYHFKSGFSGQDVTRIAPLASCENPLSSLSMRAAEFARTTRQSLGKLKNPGLGMLLRPKAEPKPEK